MCIRDRLGAVRLRSRQDHNEPGGLEDSRGLTALAGGGGAVLGRLAGCEDGASVRAGGALSR